MPIQPLGDKQTMYKEYMQGCIDKYDNVKKQGRCVETEKDRVEMSLRQPQSMVVSTDLGLLSASAISQPRAHAIARSRIIQNTDLQRFVRQMMSFNSSKNSGTSIETNPSLRTGPLETPTRTTGHPLPACSASRTERSRAEGSY